MQYRRNTNMAIGGWRWILLGMATQALVCREEQCPVSLVTSRQRGNGVCEVMCMDEVCGFDGDLDCLGKCAESGCVMSKLGDGVCDSGKC